MSLAARHHRARCSRIRSIWRWLVPIRSHGRGRFGTASACLRRRVARLSRGTAGSARRHELRAAGPGGVLEQVRAVGQDEQRAALGRRRQVRQERPRRRLVEVLGGLVEDQDPDVGEEGPGEGEALPLAARQAGAVLPRPASRGRPAAPRPSPGGGPAPGPAPARGTPAPGRASRRLSAIVESKMCGSCSHRPTARRTSSPGIDADVRCAPPSPTSSSEPASGSRNRRQAAASVLLPEPLGPVTTSARPGREVEVQPRQARASGARVADAQPAARRPSGPSGTGRAAAAGIRHGIRAAGGCPATRRAEEPGRAGAAPRRERRHDLVDGDRRQRDHGEGHAAEAALADRRRSRAPGRPHRRRPPRATRRARSCPRPPRIVARRRPGARRPAGPPPIARGAAPATMISGAPRSRSRAASASVAPRRGQAAPPPAATTPPRDERRHDRRRRGGSPPARGPPPAPASPRTATVPTATTAADPYGRRTRSHRSASPSTSPTSARAGPRAQLGQAGGRQPSRAARRRSRAARPGPGTRRRGPRALEVPEARRG